MTAVKEETTKKAEAAKKPVAKNEVLEKALEKMAEKKDEPKLDNVKKAVAQAAKKAVDEAVQNGILNSNNCVIGDIDKLMTEQQIKALPTPFVVLGGKVIQPIIKNVKAYHSRLVSEQGPEIYIPFHLGPYTKGREFSFFQVETPEGSIDLWLDDRSSVVLDVYGGFSRRMFRQKSNAGPRAVVLINSASVNDTFEGTVFLANVDSENNQFTESTITNTIPAHNRHRRTGLYLTSERPQILIDTRLTFKTSWFENSRIDSSDLSPSHYKDCEINSSTINSKTYRDFNTVHANNSVLEGKCVVLSECTLVGVEAIVDGELRIKNCRITNETFEASSLWLKNKFCFLKIDVPGTTIELYRVSEKEVRIGFPFRTSCNLKIDTTWEEVMEKVEELFDKYRRTIPQLEIQDQKDSVSNSILMYVTDTIDSRLKVIRLLDSVYSTQNAIKWDGINDYYTPDF